MILNTHFVWWVIPYVYGSLYNEKFLDICFTFFLKPFVTHSFFCWCCKWQSMNSSVLCFQYTNIIKNIVVFLSLKSWCSYNFSFSYLSVLFFLPVFPVDDFLFIFKVKWFYMSMCLFLYILEVSVLIIISSSFTVTFPLVS